MIEKLIQRLMVVFFGVIFITLILHVGKTIYDSWHARQAAPVAVDTHGAFSSGTTKGTQNITATDTSQGVKSILPEKDVPTVLRFDGESWKPSDTTKLPIEGIGTQAFRWGGKAYSNIYIDAPSEAVLIYTEDRRSVTITRKEIEERAK